MNLHNLIPNKTLLWKEWKYAGGMYLGLLAIITYLSSFQFIMDLAQCIKYPELQVVFRMSELVNYYEGGVGTFLILVVVGIAAIVMGNERDKNTFNLMLAMPFTRQQIVTSKFVTGLAAIITSFVVNALLVTMLMYAFEGAVSRYAYGFGFTVADIWVWVLTNIIVLAYVFTFTLFISTLSGTTLGNAILSIIFLVFPIGFPALILMNLEFWFPGVNYAMWEALGSFFLKITVPAYLMAPISVYPKLQVISLYFYGMIVLMMAVLYCLTVWLFNKNPMERNGEVLMFSQTEGFFKLGVTVCFALLGGVMSGYIFYPYSAAFAVLGYVITGALAWWAVTRLIERRKGGVSKDEKKAFPASAAAIVGVFLAIFIILILGYRSTATHHRAMEPITAIEAVNVDELWNYRDSYVGDASAVRGIIGHLPGNGYVQRISLQTTEMPYGIQVDYGLELNSDGREEFERFFAEQKIQQILFNNAAVLFALVQNLDTVTFNIDTVNKQAYTFSRADLESHFGRDLRQYAKDKMLWEQEILPELTRSVEK